jgi:hypothetical protein
MTTQIRHGRLFGWSVRCTGILLTLTFCASAFADPDKNVVVNERQQSVRKAKKMCYTMISGSGIPQPCSRLRIIPTTGYAMERFGTSTVP